MEGVPVLADLGSFRALEELYAERVHVDYSSLSGEPAATVAARDLMDSWAAVLPGFDRTRHEVTNLFASVDGATAIVTTDVVADHYVDSLFWQARGTYRFELQKQEGRWRIHAHTFALAGESGSREALARATERALSEASHARTEETVRALLGSLETKDMDAFARLWAEDAVQELPFAPAGFPKEVRGKDALIAHYRDWPANSGKADFTSRLVFYRMQDPAWVFASFEGRAEIVPTGRLYEQIYGGLFHVVDGKVALFREYFDPAPFRWAFGLGEDED